MKTLVYFKSLNGTTRQLAELINAAVDSDIYAVNDLLPPDLEIYDTVVLAAPIYMSKVKGANALTALWKRVQNKRVLLVTVAASPNDPEMPKWLDSSFPADLISRVQHVSLTGQFKRSFIPVLGPLSKALTGKDPVLSGAESIEPESVAPVLDALAKTEPIRQE